MFVDIGSRAITAFVAGRSRRVLLRDSYLGVNFNDTWTWGCVLMLGLLVQSVVLIAYCLLEGRPVVAWLRRFVVRDSYLGVNFNDQWVLILMTLGRGGVLCWRLVQSVVLIAYCGCCRGPTGATSRLGYGEWGCDGFENQGD